MGVEAELREVSHGGWVARVGQLDLSEGLGKRARLARIEQDLAGLTNG